MQPNLRKITRRIEELDGRRIRERVQLGPLKLKRITDPAQPAELELKPGQRWGERDNLYQLDFKLDIPARWEGQPVALRLDLSTPGDGWTINTVEGLLYINGQPFHALDRYHRSIPLPAELVAHGSLALKVKLWSGIAETFHEVKTLELRRLDEVTDQLHSLMKLLVETLEHLPTTSATYIGLAGGLDEATVALDFRHSSDSQEDFYASSRVALQKLTARLEELQLPAVTEWQPTATGVGHAHIDVAWLWQLRHTRLKAANTFATALYHMDRYPYFTFIQSQPQLYQFVKEDQPELYERIKQKAAAGQWETEGAMWVEADTNITGAESLVRQFLFGQRFFQQEFGYRSKVLWLPDVFGYSPALPQLIRGADAAYFVTSKLSWNDTNRMPADTFWWEGLDGSRVLTYFLTAQNDDVWPAYTYNAEMKTGVLARGWKNYRQKDLNRDILIAYGWGDGGGGPTREMIEAIPWLAKPLNSELPTARPGKVADFMARLEKQVGDSPLPRWVGELYFEYHRGTYTSQGRLKRANRRAEGDFHEAEWLATLAGWLTDAPYPQASLNAAWPKLLTHQFHDILPGSSIGEVYADAVGYFEEIKATTDEASETARQNLHNGLGLPAGSLVAYNSLSWPRSGLVELDTTQAERTGLPTQALDDGRSLVEVGPVGGLGYRAYEPRETKSASRANSLTVSSDKLENAFWRIELNERGQLTRLYDKAAGREVLATGARANVFQLFEDKPVDFDAWDIDAFYSQKSWELDSLTECQVIEEGPLRAGLHLRWRYNDRSEISQKLYIYAYDRRIDFVTEVEWQERQTLLKVVFPVAIRSGRATAEVQWGNIERPTHRNTSWDQARFETCAHKWFDLSEGDYGVAILNDCKYGYDAHDNVLRLTLLKGAIHPDPQADQGHHEFIYSLLPHAGSWFEAGVHKAAYELNLPLRASSLPAPTGPARLPAEFSLLEVIDASSVIIETVKQAEDSLDWIVRLYECANRRGTFQLQLGRPVSRVVEVNLLEEEIEATPVTLSDDGKIVQSRIEPFQIKTFRLTPAA